MSHFNSPYLSSVRGEIRVLQVSVTLMILFAALNLMGPLRLLGLIPDLPRILLLIYRIMDLIIVFSFFRCCGMKIKVRKLDFLLFILITYPFFIGFSYGNISITFLNDFAIYFAFLAKIVILRTVLVRIAAVTDLDTVLWEPAKKIIFWSGIIAFTLIVITFALLGSGAVFYFQAPAEITLAAALVLTQGRVISYLFFLALALMAGKRMVIVGVLAIGLIASMANARFRTAVLRIVFPTILLIPVLITFGGPFINLENSAVDKILSTYRLFIRAQNSSTSFLEMLMFLDPGRYVEYVSLKPYLTGWPLWFGNGYGFRYALDSDFAAAFGLTTAGDVSNAHFTPLAITAKFGLVGLAIWIITIGVVLSSKIHKTSYFQYACRLAFIAMIVQSVFAFSFFVNMYTPFYIAMATLGRKNTPKNGDVRAGIKEKPKGIV